jgi:anthraniloyl-CoA monooxygenase
MNILCIGGGPAGLYFSLLMKLKNPQHQITVIEKVSAQSQRGWGLVFSDQTLTNFFHADSKTAFQITEALHQWNAIDVHFKNQLIQSNGHGFSGISRTSLLSILQNRCQELGVNIEFDTDAQDETSLALQYDADIVIASDGINSTIRKRYADIFQVQIELRRCRYIWLGTTKLFTSFCFAFIDTPHGWIQAHAYQYDQHTSTFIVEMPEEVWQQVGFAHMNNEQMLASCEQIFAEYLDGHTLMSYANTIDAHQWQQFQRISCQQWIHYITVNYKNIPIVLMGDAAHTAHFSIGSGTKLAIEDAIALARCLSDADDGDDFDDAADFNLQSALEKYQEERRIEVLKLQNAARNSMEWFENVARYAAFDVSQFAYSLMTRSQRISHENLRLRDAHYIQKFESTFAKKSFESAGLTYSKQENNQPPPPMLTPYKVRSVLLKNRVVVSPMAQYLADDGCVGAHHMQHLLRLAQGGAGLVIAEMTCVAENARATLRCAGLYKSEHVVAWKKILDVVRTKSNAKMGVQLGHAGAKGSTRTISEGLNLPLPENNWSLISASDQQYSIGVSQIAKAANLADLARVKQEYVDATIAAHAAGFDWLELHCAHGYLLSSFISPLTNQRTDEYGGSLENRCRYPLEIFAAIRQVWPQEKPISVRISANDWVEGGTTPTDAIDIARLFKQAGADMIDCSSGRVSRQEKPIYGRMYQTPYADAIRNEANIPTIAVGGIFEADHVNSIIAAGRADLCAIARPHIEDPAWTIHQTEKIGFVLHSQY